MRLLALAAALLAVATPAAAGPPPPDKGPAVVVGTVAGVVYERNAGKGVIALDVLLVIDGNVQEQNEQPDALDERRTWVGAVEVRCTIANRRCGFGDWFLRQVPTGSFVYDAVRGEARLHLRLSKREVLDHYLVVNDPQPVAMHPIAGHTPDGEELVVTGGVAVSRRVAATGNLFGVDGKGVGSIVTGVLHNVYVDSPVGVRVDLSKLLP